MYAKNESIFNLLFFKKYEVIKLATNTKSFYMLNAEFTKISILN